MRPRTGKFKPSWRAPARLDVLIVCNPVAARAGSLDVQQLLVEAATARGLRHRAIETGKHADARKAIEAALRNALNDGCRRIVIAGGDGSVSMMAALLARRRRRGARPVLAIIPTGTANIMARELGIPMELPAAVELALDSDRAIDLDAIVAGDRLVFTQLGVGLDAKMILNTSREEQIRKGRMAYVTAFVRQAIGHRSATFTLEIDGERVKLRALQVVVANVGAMGAPPFTWGPGIDPSDGVLDVCVYTASSLRERVQLVFGLLTGNHDHTPQTRYFRATRSVVIATRWPMLVQGDGELLGRTPVTLGVARKAVRLCVPKEIESIEPTPGAPGEMVDTAAVPEKQTVAEPAETIAEDVVTMVAQHSRTWVLQGWARHPLAFLQALDAALFLRVNGLHFGPFADRALILLSNFMHYGEGWAIVAVVMLIADFSAGLRLVAEAMVVLWATMLTVNFPLKRLFGRHRPFTAYVSARVRGPKPLDSSFPSGHTAAAFAGALLFGAHAPWWIPVFYSLASLVGFSRIYLGVHYPGDVVIGAVVGTLLAGSYLTLLRLALAAWGM